MPPATRPRSLSHLHLVMKTKHTFKKSVKEVMQC